MATDDFGQGINVAALLDAPDAATLARNLANGIASRSILRFASASARAAALTGVSAPTAGMHSYLEDTQRLYFYTGSVWRQVSSLTQQGSVNLSWTNANTASVTVTFPFAFASTPNVFVNINSGNGAVARWSCRAYQITATNFVAFLYAADAASLTSGSAIPVQWLASLT
uniref:H-type lectin domain-containing protein n=1 Tax=Streptomyces sp. NBC_01177 TaxID=2903761 RepID=UPI002F91567B|nr:H-type lectin domain-containing protein [Streptomyces sp. NBC_01177]